jgi:hypothetical protein
MLLACDPPSSEEESANENMATPINGDAGIAALDAEAQAVDASLPLPDAHSPDAVAPPGNDAAVTPTGVGVTPPGSTAPPIMQATGIFDGEIVAAAMDKSVGGYPVPFWLYKGGVAPFDTDGLLPISADAVKHRAANPDLWTEWRRVANSVERKVGRDWKLLAYDDEYAALPSGTTVDATFNAEYDAYQTRKYRFSDDNTFEYCKYVSLVQSGERSSGTYDIDGYVIRLRFPNGSSESYSFVYDPSKRPNTMWFNQTPFKRVNNETAATPLGCR